MTLINENTISVIKSINPLDRPELEVSGSWTTICKPKSNVV